MDATKLFLSKHGKGLTLEGRAIYNQSAAELFLYGALTAKTIPDFVSLCNGYASWQKFKDSQIPEVKESAGAMLDLIKQQGRDFGVQITDNGLEPDVEALRKKGIVILR
ncbi:MAG: hypothetical protein JXB19_00300 [Bacteroidales bacterium]|nr:hypothetical protein [Bacteroidales bacterium]